MRRLVYYVACTIDGFIAREDGSFDWCLTQGEHFADLLEYSQRPLRLTCGTCPARLTTNHFAVCSLAR